MAITNRQTGLLAAENWKRVYQTFKEADFTAYDFETLRKSMIDYIKQTYPEDYNDFTESSEFIALIDLIAFLGQSLAFRADLNARENFLDTAERRDSILKLARLVSYNPKRHIPAMGYLKIDSVSTSETLSDSDGIDITNVVINWDDSSDENWLERFTLIINAALVSNQAVGRPGSSKKINNIRTDEYSINTLSSLVPVFRFESTVEGQKVSFEAVSATTSNQDYVYEAAPNTQRVFNILYRNNGAGNDSTNTGFFVYFKQGELNVLNLNIPEAVPNKVLDVDIDGINNTDVWLYTVDSLGTATDLWTQVPSAATVNIVYNKQNQRNLYQVNSKANDQISLVFGDGTFANIPQGSYRLYYRTGNGLTYKITPDEIRGIPIAIDYLSRSGRVETITIRASLKYTVATANARETLDDIKQRAPQQYYTQNRMVTGEDYNILPYTSFSNIVKVQAVNRTSSGISRYLDIIDGTGRYSSTDIFADDGVLYRENFLKTFTFRFDNYNDIQKLISGQLRDILTSPETLHYYYETVPGQAPIDTGIPPNDIFANRFYVIKLAGTTDFTRFGSNNNLEGTSFVANVSGRLIKNYTVINSATSSYRFSGAASGNNPDITLYEGDRLNFNVNTLGSPFWIKTLPGTGSTNYIVAGNISNNGISSGTVSWDTLGVEPGIYYYSSENYAAQSGNIIIQSQGTGQVRTLFRWVLGQSGDSSANGYFIYNFNPSAIGTAVNTRNRYLRPGALVLFVAPTGSYFDSNNNLVSGTPTRQNESTFLYASIVHVSGDGTNNGQGLYSDGSGPVVLNTRVPTGALVNVIIPHFVNSFNGDFAGLIIDYILGYRSFMLHYDINLLRWRIKNYSVSDTDYFISFVYNINNQNYTVSYRGINYLFHSPRRVNFYVDERQHIYDLENNRVVEDTIRILRNNSMADTVSLTQVGTATQYLYNVPLQQDYTWKIYKSKIDNDGYTDTSTVYLTYSDTNNDGVPDNPALFASIVAPATAIKTKLVFFREVQDADRFKRLELVDNATVVTTFNTMAQANQNLSGFLNGQLFFLTSDLVFKQLSISGTTRSLVSPQQTYKFFLGRQGLNYQYVHNSPYTNRIDPSISNIIDLYVLTADYNLAYRQWIQDTSGRLTEPRKLTSTELANAYSSLNNSKVLTDTLIFNSAKFKPLFGNKAVESLQATFKIVKNANLNLSDNDIKSSVIAAINEYFSSDNWDFGETFYFSELSAYLHKALSPDIASIILVAKDTQVGFGALYQVNAEPHELIISAATVQDVEIISSVTAVQLNQIRI